MVFVCVPGANLTAFISDFLSFDPNTTKALWIFETSRENMRDQPHYGFVRLRSILVVYSFNLGQTQGIIIDSPTANEKESSTKISIGSVVWLANKYLAFHLMARRNILPL